MDTYSKYSDEELFKLLKSEKKIAEQAFAVLYARHSQAVYAYSIRALGSTQDAQDCFQETFLKLFHLANNQSEVNSDLNEAENSELAVKNLKAFLMRIVRNLCLNFKRDKKEFKTLDDLDYYHFENHYEKKELNQMVAQALELLDYEHREAFILRHYHGYSYNEISEITGTDIAAIKTRYWRAKERIKNILSPYLINA